MSIEKQVEILNSLVQIMHESAKGAYEEIRCEFDHEVYDEGWSVGSKYSFIRDGSFFSEYLDDPEDRVSSLVHELHELMKSHTGGDWKKFVLTLAVGGKANTKFTY
ncbi:hypothetical protein [Achromobacter sp. KK8]|jgi:hypothetical protein